MAEIIGGKEYESVEVTANYLEITIRSVQRYILSNKLTAIKKTIEKAPGWCWLVEVDSWPEEAKNKYYKDGIGGRGSEVGGQVLAVQTFRQAQGQLAVKKQLRINTRLSGMDCGLRDWQQKQAALRYDLVANYMRAKSSAAEKGIAALAAAEDYVKAYNSGILYPALFEAIGPVARSTLDRWQTMLRKNNFDMFCLAPRYGDHLKGTRKISELVFAYVMRFALQPVQHPITECIRLARHVMEKDGVECDVSDSTIRRAVFDWRDTHYDRWVFCREGEKALNDKVLPYIERDADLLEVGDVLVVDGHTLNFTVVNPYTGRPGRATLLVMFDWKSRMPAGWYIMMTENIQCVHAALRRAILALGKIPKYVFLDNGRAFRAEFFTGIKDFSETGIDGLYKRLGIKAVFAKPYNAQSKPVERFFGSFAELERLAPTYSGTSIARKPAWLLRNEKLHKDLHQSWMLTIEQADMAITAWVEQHYATRPHRGLNNRTPREVWEEGRGKGIDEKFLWLLMLCETKRLVNRNGVNLFGINYYDEALYGYKEPVNIRYDMHNLDEVFVYTEDDDHIICVATRVEKLHPMAQMTGNPLDLKSVQEANKAKARLKKSTESEFRRMAHIISSTGLEQPRQLPPGEAEALEQQAREVEVIDMTPRISLPERAGVYFDTEERYRELIDIRASGQQLTDEEEQLWAEFEAGEEFARDRDYFERLKKTAGDKYQGSGVCDRVKRKG